ncbi:hypothetical protein [Mechercharimyces sp. CAU 1602]|nr:hypothetical protein [Mechercharimyces sp. CAU 1602]MCS1350281.1 hypothetical protein [Mechercharimyces sp. CAU 1602]
MRKTIAVVLSLIFVGSILSLSQSILEPSQVFAKEIKLKQEEPGG